MSNWPVEISRKILYHLDTPDLKQCQLTCQYWHTLATEQLYDFVRLEQRYQLDLFMQTVKNESSLGLLVKKIHIHFYKYESSVKDHKFLDFVISFCPNLVYISIPHHDPPHYVQLINAGYHDKHKYLEEIELPRRRTDTLKYYNCATLAFRKSIKTLELRDTIDLTPTSRDHLFADDFVWLRSELHHFTKLEKLTVVQHTNEGLIGINDIIDTCHTLKHLITTFVPSPPFEFEDTSLDIASTQPCTHVKIFEGHDTLLDHQNSVKYLMRKFPKLQKLKLTDQSFHFIRKRLIDTGISGLTVEVTKEFLQYLSQITSVTVEFNLNGVDIDTLIDVMLKNNNRFDNKITLEYDVYGKDVYFEDQMNTTIRFNSTALSSPTALSDELFIEKSGEYIRVLSVYSLGTPYSLIKDMGAWLGHIVQHCPNLKELELKNSIYMRLDPRGINEHVSSSLRKLTVHGLQSSSVLPHLCALFPRLNCLSISSTHESRSSAQLSEKDTVHFLNMPHISLDKLVWIYGAYGYVTDFQYHIKVTTDSGTFYYVADVKDAKPSTAEDFKVAFEKSEPILDINCKKLVDLHITHMNLSQKIYHLDV